MEHQDYGQCGCVIIYPHLHCIGCGSYIGSLAPIGDYRLCYAGLLSLRTCLTAQSVQIPFYHDYCAHCIEFYSEPWGGWRSGYGGRGRNRNSNRSRNTNRNRGYYY
jgi:hypothetical protein